MSKVQFTKKKSKVITDLRDLVCTSAEEFGERVRYYYFENKEQKAFTYQDIRDRMNEMGTAFFKLGIMGGRIAVIGDAHPHYMTVYYSAINGGGVIVPLDKELADEQIVNFLNLSEAVAIAYTEKYNGRLTALADQLPGVRYFIPLQAGETAEGEKILPVEKVLEIGREALDAGERAFLDCPLDTKQMAALLFTSGTTGTSKGVMLSHDNLTTAINSSCQSMAYDENNTFVSVLPMHHAYEMTCGQLAMTNIGSTSLLNDSMKNVMRNFKQFAPNTLLLVPLFVETMHKRIWSEIDKKKMHKKVKFAIKLSNFLMKLGIDRRFQLFSQIREAFGGNLTSIVCGGAPISPTIVKDFYAFGIDVLEGYGITECSPLVAVNQPGKIRFHSVGQPVADCEVKIDKTPEEETGEILVKGGNVMLGYYQNEQATAEVFTEDGWFRTGDIGYQDKDGYIYITGRKKNVIILSNGKNIFPEELEEHLSHLDSVEESVVLSRPNENGDPIITAIIYPTPAFAEGKTDEQLLALLKDEVNQVNRRLPLFKQIHAVELRKTEFEKTTSKKIIRYKVK